MKDLLYTRFNTSDANDINKYVLNSSYRPDSSELKVKQVLACYGIPVVKMRLKAREKRFSLVWNDDHEIT